MTANTLRWLVLLGPLGTLGMVGLLPRPLWPLQIFLVFTVLWRTDERTERNLGRAAITAYAVTLAVLTTVFVLLSVPRDNFATYSVWLTGYGMIATLVLSVVSFVAAYLYYELRGV